MTVEDGAAAPPFSVPPRPLRRLAVVHQGALGDFLLALPAIEGLVSRFPGLIVDFLSKPAYVSLLASRNYVGRIESHDGPALVPFFHEESWRDAPVPAILQDSDALLVFGQKTGRILAARLARRLARPVHHVQSFPSPGGHHHVSDFIFDQMCRLGWFPGGCTLPQTAISPPSKDVFAAQEWLAQHDFREDNKPLLIHPGSGGHAKIWPLSRWWALLHVLSSRCIPVLMTLGPADEALEAFAGAVRGLGVTTLRDLSLPRLCAFLRESRMYVGNDSGVSHLAALSGVACVVVFGPTDPAVWSPRGPNVRIVRSRWEGSEVFAWSPAVPAPPPEPWVGEVFQWEGR